MENNRMLLLWSHYTKSLRILCNSYSSGRKWIEFLCSVLVSCTDFCLLASAMLWFKRKREASETYWLPQTFEILILLKSSPSVNMVKENEEKCVFRLENGSKMVDRSSKTRGNAPPPLHEIIIIKGHRRIAKANYRGRTSWQSLNLKYTFLEITMLKLFWYVFKHYDFAWFPQNSPFW